MTFVDVALVLVSLAGFLRGSVLGIDRTETRIVFALLSGLGLLSWISWSGGLPATQLLGNAIFITSVGVLMYTLLSGKEKADKRGWITSAKNNNLGGIVYSMFTLAIALSVFETAISSGIIQPENGKTSLLIDTIYNHTDEADATWKLASTERP